MIYHQRTAKYSLKGLSTDSNIMQWKDLGNDRDSSLLLKLSPNLELLLNHFNHATPENRNDPEKTSSSTGPFRSFSTGMWQNVQVNTIRQAMVCYVYFSISKIL